VGRTYDFTWKYYQGLKVILAAKPVPTPTEFWEKLISSSFYVEGLHLPSKIKLNLLTLNVKFISAMLEQLYHGNYTLLDSVLPEPYASAYVFHNKQKDSLFSALFEMTRLGLSQPAAETLYFLYGGNYKATLATPEKLFDHPLPESLKATPKYGLIEFINQKAACGITILDNLTIPQVFQSSIDACRKQGLIVTGLNKLQLSTHAIQQRLLRLELQRLTRGFYPRYAESEITYSYSRYFGIIGTLDKVNFQSQVTTAINSRLTYLSCDSHNRASSYIDELSAILQILGHSVPYLVTRTKRESDYFSNNIIDVAAITLKALPTSDKSYRTIIIPNFHYYTLAELHQLFTKLTERDRIVAMSDLNRATHSHSGTLVAKQLAKYFPQEDISSREQQIHLHTNEPLKFNSLKVKQDLMESHLRVAVCDNHELAHAINQLLLDPSQPTVLIKSNSAYKKHDRVIIHHLGTHGDSPVHCQLLSTNDNGIYAASRLGYIRISASSLHASTVSHAYAMTVEMAIDLEIPEVILVSSWAHTPTLRTLLADHGIRVIRSYVYSAADFPDFGIPAIQRITPMVE
jgi:hypothetical protein